MKYSAPKVKKRLEKLSKCPQGCKGRIIGYGKYCQCIEDKLPSLATYKSVAMRFVENIERFAAPEPKELEEGTETDELEKKLKRYGLTQYEVELVLARFSDGMTLSEIMKSQGWTSSGSCSYHLKKVMQKLRERKYK